VSVLPQGVCWQVLVAGAACVLVCGLFVLVSGQKAGTKCMSGQVLLDCIACYQQLDNLILNS
jgi:hypothetical protein